LKLSALIYEETNEHLNCSIVLLFVI